jgi:hypothetical protein
VPDVEPWDVYNAGIAAAKPEQYANILPPAEMAKISWADFVGLVGRLKDEILGCKGVRPVHSFIDANGRTVDCFPRQDGLKMPPPQSSQAAHDSRAGAEGSAAHSPSPCPPETVKITRPTLEQKIRDHLYPKVAPPI